MLVYGILQKFSFANSSSGRIADGVDTTAEETRFAFAIASCKLSPFFRQAMTEPMCESPARWCLPEWLVPAGRFLR